MRRAHGAGGAIRKDENGNGGALRESEWRKEVVVLASKIKLKIWIRCEPKIPTENLFLNLYLYLLEEPS